MIMQTCYIVTSLAPLDIGTSVEYVVKGYCKNVKQLLMCVDINTDKINIFISSGVRLWLQLMDSTPSFILGHV